ncbi:MAG: chemotaxis-specific protein-glutamate methyltransferase CheB, partial [Desulfobacteraceae bacterium]|nr:chemotaxis-specific protein-glutamate methyltransferase CheB [Desulfobacteraceae bacterium]
MKKIKVLIVDDSAVVRQTLEQILNTDRQIEVIATASDPVVAAQRMKTEIPDVITLDIEMPRMDGITFLKKLMTQHPLPVVICSSHTGKGSKAAFKAMEYGAVEIISLPKIGTKQFLQESSILICDVVRAAAQTKRRYVYRKPVIEQVAPKYTADKILAKADPRMMVQTTEKVIVVGASTGGTTALQVFLEALPLRSPGFVVVQHMPENFTTAFAERLNAVCRVKVKEATDNDPVVPGQVLIAPGNKHTLLKRSGVHYYVEVKNGPLVSRHRPSV